MKGKYIMRKFLFFALALALSGCGLLDSNEPENPSNGDNQGGGGNGGSSTSVAVNGCLPGKFSVSASHTISFSQGNLLYQASSNRFRFHAKQYQIVGGEYYGNIFHDGIRSRNEDGSKDYEGWIDMFSWGAGNEPWKRGEEAADLTTFYDWGNHTIENGGGANAWRTLSASEWQYLLKERPNATQKVGFCNMQRAIYTNIYLERNEFAEDFTDHYALMLIPDNWTCPSGITLVPIAAQSEWGWMDSNAEWDEHGLGWWLFSSYDSAVPNDYKISEVEKLEASGVVFLPATGTMYDGSYSYSSDMGYYWSCNEYEDPLNPQFNSAYAMNFKALYPATIAPAEASGVGAGYAVRLVKDVK